MTIATTITNTAKAIFHRRPRQSTTMDILEQRGFLPGAVAKYDVFYGVVMGGHEWRPVGLNGKTWEMDYALFVDVYVFYAKCGVGDSVMGEVRRFAVDESQIVYSWQFCQERYEGGHMSPAWQQVFQAALGGAS